MTLVQAHTRERAVDSRKLIRKAHAYLDAGKKCEASETGWEAVYHRLKAIADNRAWKYESDTDFYNVANLLHAEFGGPDLNVRLRLVATHSMHQDYMIESVPEFWIRHGINDADALLDFLDQVE